MNFLTLLTSPTLALPRQDSAGPTRSLPETNSWDIALGLIGVFALLVLFVIGTCVALSRWADGRRIALARRTEIAVDVAARHARSTEAPAAGSADRESALGGGLHSRRA